MAGRPTSLAVLLVTAVLLGANGAYAQQCGTSQWRGSSAVALTYRSYAQEFGLRGAGWSRADSAYGGQQWWTCAGGALHRCDASGDAQTQACPSGCTAGPLGTNDRCNGGAARSRDDSAWRGSQLWTCSAGVIHECDAAQPVKVQCPASRSTAPYGVDDSCN